MKSTENISTITYFRKRNTYRTGKLRVLIMKTIRRPCMLILSISCSLHLSLLLYIAFFLSLRHIASYDWVVSFMYSPMSYFLKFESKKGIFYGFFLTLFLIDLSSKIVFFVLFQVRKTMRYWCAQKTMILKLIL